MEIRKTAFLIPPSLKIGMVKNNTIKKSTIQLENQYESVARTNHKNSKNKISNGIKIFFNIVLNINLIFISPNVSASSEVRSIWVERSETRYAVLDDVQIFFNQLRRYR